MRKTTKIYVFIFEDKNGNELTRKESDAYSLKQAKEFARVYKSSSNMNGLHKIIVRAKY